MISSSRGTVEQQQQQEKNRSSKQRGGVCTVNTEFQDAVLPDLNIAHVPSADDDVAPVAAASDERLGNGEREQILERQAAAESPSPSWLPEGWISESRIRGDGHRDKYYIESYTGRRFRSKVEVFKYLETGVPPARWKRKGKAIEATGASHGADAPPRFADQQRESLGLFGAASSGFGTGADFFVARSVSTSSGVSASDTFKSSQAAFHSLRDVIMNGVTPPPATAAAPFPSQRSYEVEETTAAKKPVFFDYWASTLGTGSGVTNLASTAQRSSSSWTENYKVGSTFLNGMASSVPSFSSKTTHQTSESTTPHWLDRILNKPPPGPISQPGYSFGLTGGFVQSPLHYLQNAGAFQNNWLNLKPPSAITQSDYDVPWKSRSWFDMRDPSAADRLERSAINLNHPLVDPEEETRAQYKSEYQGQSHEFSSRKSEAASSRSLENLWKKAVPITLEHREFVAYSNGSNATNSAAAKPSKSSHHHSHHHQHQHHQSQQQQQHHHSQQQQQQHQKSEVGVKRGGQKIDRYQEKKRLERLGTRLCEQGLARLVRELKDGKRGIDLN